MSLVYGPFTALREDPRPWTMSEKILYNTTVHLGWGIVVAWVVYACEYGYGGTCVPMSCVYHWSDLQLFSLSPNSSAATDFHSFNFFHILE